MEQRGVWVSWSLPLFLAWTLLAIYFLCIPRIKAKSVVRSMDIEEDSDMYNMSNCNAYFETSNEKKILDFLVGRNKYDPRNRPIIDESEPTRVNVSVILLSLSSPDESSLNYEVEFLLQLTWVDHRLCFEANSSLAYLTGHHHLKDIWQPDLVYIKHGHFKKPMEPDEISFKIFRNGTISYTRRLYVVLYCEGNLNVFPFDDPYCTFSLESRSYEQKDVIFTWFNDLGSNNGTSLKKYDILKSLNAYLISNNTRNCYTNATFNWRGNYSCLQVELHFSRDDSFYISTVFAPSIILVFSSFITFWLEWNAVPARVMIGVTTMLNFFTTSNSFRSSLPVVSNLSAMNLWDGVCMCFIFASLCEFVFVNYRGRKRPAQNMIYTPGENLVVQVLSENRHRIPQAIHRIGLSLVSGWREYFAERRRSNVTEEAGNATAPAGIEADHGLENRMENRNSHEHMTCTDCGNSQCSLNNVQNSCSVAPETRKREFTHPIRVAKSIDVVSRAVFPLGYAIFLLYFFITYKVIT